MRGWALSAMMHFSGGDLASVVPWSAVRLRLMPDPGLDCLWRTKRELVPQRTA